MSTAETGVVTAGKKKTTTKQTCQIARKKTSLETMHEETPAEL